jgi:rRNA-processing protein FCF1
LQLRSVFDDDRSLHLFDERYWRIREIKDDSVRPFPLISSAIRRHEAQLQEMLAQLATYKHVCGTSDSTLAILDTNIYDHYQLFTQINWNEVLGAKSVRLLVPLVVVDELDGQKDNRESRLGKRAGKVIKALRGLPFVAGDRGPRLVRPGIELDYLPEPPGHVRRASNDDEVVRQAAYICSIAPNRVVLITGDLGMQVRAMNQDVPHILMPENYLATPEPAA